MQHFMIPCDFGGRKAPFPIYVGEPKSDSHPLQHQSTWLSSERGGSIPQEVMDSFEKLHNIAKENNVSFEELCVYAMGEALGTEETAAVSAPAAPPSMDDLVPEPEMPTENQFQPVSPPPAPQTMAERHTQHESHQTRVEAAEQDPNDPYRNNQS